MVLKRALVFTMALAGLTSTGEAVDSGIIDFMQCLKDKKAAVVSAHRGGPAPGFPENAIETLERGRRQGVRLFEVDTAKAADGTLYMMHDKTLDRTTTGEGLVGDITGARLSALKLEDNAGALTGYGVPTLKAMLIWAQENDAFLNLDVKNSAPMAEIAAEVMGVDADDRVVIIAGSIDKGREALSLMPRAMVSLNIFNGQSLQDIVDSGIPLQQISIWAGFRRIDQDFIGKLDEAGLAVSFGTLGFGNSYDDRFAAAGDNRPYADLAKLGVAMIATDRPLAARSGLLDAKLAWDSGTICD